MQFLINFGVNLVILGHNWHLGGTPWNPWDCQGVPGWNFDEFLVHSVGVVSGYLRIFASKWELISCIYMCIPAGYRPT